jgi:hypothetical protein
MTGINKELYERMTLIIKERNHNGTVETVKNFV